MKKIFLNPLVAMTVATLTLYGCAGTGETANSTATNATGTENSTATNSTGTENSAATEETSMNQTTTMAGSTSGEFRDLDVLVIQKKAVIPVATLDVTALAMENPEEVDDMFEAIDDTEQYDVLSLARKSPNLSTFVKLIEQAGLANDLQRVEQVTLFAPTNEAFAKMPKETLTKLLTAENAASLSTLLQVHILASDVASTQLQDNTRIRVTENSYIPVSTGTAGANTNVGGAQLIKSDVQASNGRIHVIDSVILPSESFMED